VIRKIVLMAGFFLLITTLTCAQQPNGAGFKIDGRLVDGSSNQPIAHARVAMAAVTQRNDFTTVVTAEDGLFSFSGLEPGKYTLSAQAHGYVFQAFNQHDQYSSSIVVGVNTNSSGLVFRLYKENVIEGTVTDEAGEPVRDANITLYQTGTANGSAGTRVRSHGATNDEGHYHIGHLAPGDYMISVVARVWYARRRHLNTTIANIRGGTMGSSISLAVGDGARDSAPSEPETPNALDLAYPTTFFPGVTEAGSAAVIHLSHGEKYVADFNLQTVRALHMKVAAPENPQTHLNFQLAQKMMDGTTTPVSTQSTRLPNGEWEIEGIAPGQYTLTAFTYTPPKPGEKPGPLTQTSTTREINATGNDVVDDGKTTPAAVVKAKLLFDPGAAVSKTSSLVLFDFKTRRSIAEQISENGEIEFKEHVPPGNYEVSINSNGSSFIRSVLATGTRAYGRTVVIRGSVPVKLEIAIGKGQGQINGVALRDGQPLAGVMIVAVPADPVHNQVLFRRDQSDSDGTFTLLNVVPEEYTVLALENGWDMQWLKPAVLKPYLAQGEVLRVEQNGKYELKLKVQ
jgi:hypothetical protein